MRLALVLLGLLLLAGCAPPPRAFERDDSYVSSRRLPRDKIELAIAPPRNMPDAMAERVAAALAIELQSYGVLAAVAPAEAPLQVTGTMSTRDAPNGIEVQIDWRVAGTPDSQPPATSRTRARSEDYAEASDRLVSRIAQQAAPRVATLIGRPPNFTPRSPGEVMSGLTIPEEPPADPAVAAAEAAKTATDQPVAAAGQQPAQPQAPQVKVLVESVTGAPSDGNRQLTSGMRRALGSSKIVLVDGAGPDVFVVSATVSLTPLDEQRGQLVVKWLLKDSTGRKIGDIEQANPVPLAAAKGSWAGFGDIVATAASEGILELLEKAINGGAARPN
ncbi:MAG: hypothetical protein U1E23_19920 [Reyranellaceae bacterium]